jgi:chromosome segregation ATPase
MRIELKRLTLGNFKGVKKFIAPFTSSNTEVFGANGTGKTTLYDSFLWLLFDKDSTGRKDFEIKTLSPDGTTKKDIEHSVEGVFDIDGTEITLKKIYREKWTRKRGLTTEEFTGNETTYFWNDVPVKKDEYMSKISNFITDEETFRLLSDVKYFNSLTWQQRRQMLFSLIDETAFEPKGKELKKRLKGKSTDELRRELAASKKKLLTEIDQSPIRIDEINRTLRDEVTVEDIEPIENEINSIDSQLGSQESAGKAYNVKLSKLNARKSELATLTEERRSEIRNKYRNLVADDEREIRNLENELSSIDSRRRLLSGDIESSNASISNYESQLNELRSKYISESSKEFSDDLTCPTCGNGFPESKKQELINKFNENKSIKLENINKEGLELKGRKEKYSKEIESKKTELAELNPKYDSIQNEIELLRKNVESTKSTANDKYFNEIENDSKLKEYDDEVAKIDGDLSATSNKTDNTDLIIRRRSLYEKIESIRGAKNNNEIRLDQLKRIDEIEAERLKLLDELSGVEKLEFELSDYVKEKVSKIEKGLSKIFNGVEFKMFDVQINGGMTDACIVQRNGVPYSDLNTASKIWVSLNIISAFSKIKELQAPIFIDNRESVTSLPELTQQTISLIVSPEHKSLTIK